MKTGRPRTAQEALPKPTAGEVFPNGSMIELVRDTGAHSRLHLLLWKNGKATVSDRIEYEGQIFVPIELDPTLARAVRLPTLSVDYGTTSSLFTQIKDLLSKYADVNEKDILILSYFVLGTWFSDCMSDALCLFVVAPQAAAEARILFLLLNCLCRHATLLGEFTRSIVASLLVPLLQPTLLIDQPDLSRSALRQLRATNTRGRHISHKGQLLDLFCAKAVHSKDSLQMGSEYGSIQITVPPSIRSLSRFDLPTQELIANQFQSKLLMYRLKNFHTIKQSPFDVEGFTLPTRTTVRSLARCIVGDTELQSAVIRLFEGQDAMCRVDRSTQIKAVVVEAMLGLWHAEQPKKLLVGEITVAVNTILKGRAETVELQAREIGEELRDLGFYPNTRTNRGFVIHMMNDVVRKVHRLAHSYSVRSIQDSIKRCAHCENH